MFQHYGMMLLMSMGGIMRLANYEITGVRLYLGYVSRLMPRSEFCDHQRAASAIAMRAWSSM